MSQELDNSCGNHFAAGKDYVFFQGGPKRTGLYKVKRDGSERAKQLDNNCGNLVVPGDGYVYFQGGDKRTGLYRVRVNGANGSAKPLDDNCGDLAVSNGYVFFQGGPKRTGLYKRKCDGTEPKQLDNNCGNFVVPGDGYVYFQGGPERTGLYRVSVNGANGSAKPLNDNCGDHFAVSSGYVFFQGGPKRTGLYKVKCDGSNKSATQLDNNCGNLVVPGDGYVYFQGGDKRTGLYRVSVNGANGSAKQIDDNCGDHFAVVNGYVYFQGGPGRTGLYRVAVDPQNGPAAKLDNNCGNLVVTSDPCVYFQGGPQRTGLYGLCIAVPSAPEGLRMRIQDEYEVNTVLGDDINPKLAAIKTLLDEANNWNGADTWFINFSSAASSGAYPDAVAARINSDLKQYIKSYPVGKRLGTIVMDFPDDQGRTDMIDELFKRNPVKPNASPDPSATDWMSNVPDETTLSQLTIPGTHDSCTSGAKGMSKCQNLTLEQQLAAGIRFIDIRCRQLKDKFELHHGREYLNLDFDYVLKACKEFLNSNGGECIVMSVKEEHDAAENKLTFEDVFAEYVKPDLAFWYLGDTIPKLGDVRKRIVLLRRFYISSASVHAKWGIDLSGWLDDKTFSWPYEPTLQ